METIKTEELKEKKYKKLLDELTPDLVQAVENAADETGIREDVLTVLKEVNGSIEGALLYDFLTNHFYGAEWYELFGKILKEKENGEDYLEILKEIVEEKRLSAADVLHIYQNTDSEYGFQQVLEDQQIKEKEKEPTKESRIGKEPKKKKPEKTSTSASPADSVYEELYQEVTETAAKSESAEIRTTEAESAKIRTTEAESAEIRTTEAESVKTEDAEKSDQHDQLVAAVINANNEYKDMKHKLKEMKKMAHIQNNLLLQYKESAASLQKEYDQLKAAHESLKQQYEELKQQHETAVSRLAEINNFTAKTNGSRLFL